MSTIKGLNTFQFTENTMIEIVQHYLNTVLLKDNVDVSVGQVKFDHNNNLFNIQIVDSDPLVKEGVALP